MNATPPSDRVTTQAIDLRKLHGKVVLLKTTRDQRNPPTAMRGWIEIHESTNGEPEVRIAVEFPQMFSTRAHHRTIPLETPDLERLLASENNGTYEFTTDNELI
jgi:hypothetical protein